MGGTCSKPVGFELTEKERQKCIVVSNRNTRTTTTKKEVALHELARLQIQVYSAEVVVYLRPIVKNSRQVQDPTTLSPEALQRVLRTLLVTPGTLQVMARKSGVVVPDGTKKYPSIIYALRQLKLIAYDATRDLIILVGGESTLPPQVTMYQTPFPSRFLCHLAQSLANAFCGVPPWAIPVQFKLAPLTLPASTRESQAQALGKDGGFSSCFAAHVVASMVLYIPRPTHSAAQIPPCYNIRRIITEIISQQQPNMPWLQGRMTVLDVNQLVDQLLAKIHPTGEVREILRKTLIPGVLDCLPFNLEFRTLRINKISMREIQTSLARVLLYNVTLREVDLSGTNLRGMGKDLGQALSMNIQPLISHINITNCKLEDQDWNGLMVGLARLWCGGSAVLQGFSIANNPRVKRNSWNAFWNLLLNPSTFSWPSSPPPPPSLNFLQHLDITDTYAAGPSLTKLIGKLSGLRSLRMGFSSWEMDKWTMQVMQALVTSEAPLESFHGLNLRVDDKRVLADALHSRSSTLKRVVLKDFKGNAAPLLCAWPTSVPRLSLEFKGNLSGAGATATRSTDLFTAASLTVRGESHTAFCRQVLSTLGQQANGLTSLYLYDVSYVEIVQAGAETALATCGLKTLHVSFPPKSPSSYPPVRGARSCDYRYRQQFWSTMALSKTLEEVCLQNQFEDCSCRAGTHDDEIVMIGKFLKANRSVRRLSFDSDKVSLKVESVKVLRSAFYGNKKVVAIEYPSKAKANTIQQARATTQLCTREVASAKAEIKRIFKRHYSKHNRNWRDGPNRLKLPHVERIRVAKRKIGKTNRDVAKIGLLLNQINQCITKNKWSFDQSMAEKTRTKLARRKPQLTGIVAKKKKVFEKLVSKLHRAKRRGRKKKSGKEQVPRGHYYRNSHMWPERRFGPAGSSHYRRWNDPYNVRYGYGWLHYPIDFDDDEPEIVVENEDSAALPSYVVAIENFDVACAPDLVESPELGLFPDVSLIANDPWTPIDTMVATGDSSTNMLMFSDYRSQISMEAIELGLDVLFEIVELVAEFASLFDKMENIADRSGLETAEVTDYVESIPGQDVDVSELVDVLPAVDEYTVDEADEAVDMYAGAGPRDLDDGGPCFGGGSTAVEAGARRRARTRKHYRTQRRVRLTTSQKLQERKSLSLPSHIFDESENRTSDSEVPFHPWPDDISNCWNKEVTAAQIEVISQSDILSLRPDVSLPKQFLEWSNQQCFGLESQPSIDVALVTQCSVDRLNNLREQLASWKGKASVTVYVTENDLASNIEDTIVSIVDEARRQASQTGGDLSKWDVAVSIVEAHCNDEPYPINYLRNVALLQARSQFLATGHALEKTAVLLADVDFRPSLNLHDALHCSAAADEIIYKRRAIVVPAFEDSTVDDMPRNISELRSDVDHGVAMGFHLSHFPPGHTPTDFEAFWLSSSTEEPSVLELWKGLYPVKYQRLFEPYVVLRTPDVPLYDERFQGYGLNKVTHLASISKEKRGDLFVLPGVFLVAPCHEHSQSWADIYGRPSDDSRFNKMYLKGLYHDFSLRLSQGKSPIVSSTTESWQEQLLQAASTSLFSDLQCSDSQPLPCISVTIDSYVTGL